MDIKNLDDMQEFIKAILTPDELNAINTRLKIVKLLKEEKMSQHEIAKKLGVGVGTVTRGMRELKSNHFRNI